MSFFTTELMRCTKNFEDKKCIGNAMYIPLGKNNLLKLFFTTIGYADHYEALSISVVDKNNGVIDKNIIKFSDVWGRKQVSNPNFKDGVIPHVWKHGSQDFRWYVYTPNHLDMELLSGQISDYAQMFMK